MSYKHEYLVFLFHYIIVNKQKKFVTVPENWVIQSNFQS